MKLCKMNKKWYSMPKNVPKSVCHQVDYSSGIIDEHTDL